MGSPTVPFDLILGDLEKSNSQSLKLSGLISCKGAELGHMLLRY